MPTSDTKISISEDIGANFVFELHVIGNVLAV